MQLSILTPEKTLFSAPAAMVVVPGTEGDFGVLPGHAPFISLVRPGIVTIQTEDGGQRKIAVADGVAEAVPERCTVLAEIAEDCTDVSPADAQARLEAAKGAFDQADTDKARSLAEKKLLMAQAVVDNAK